MIVLIKKNHDDHLNILDSDVLIETLTQQDVTTGNIVEILEQKFERFSAHFWLNRESLKLS